MTIEMLQSRLKNVTTMKDRPRPEKAGPMRLNMCTALLEVYLPRDCSAMRIFW